MSNQIVNKNFIFQETGINVLGTVTNPLFLAGQIAGFLEYVDTTKAIYKHVSKEHKTTIRDLMERSPNLGDLVKLHKDTVLINEMGVYELIFSSKMEKAKQFQKWVFSDVLPSIRKTGSYVKPVHNQFQIMSEKDLHQKVVDFLRKQYPHIILSASLGELQDTSDKRIESYKSGYQAGIPDLIINQQNKNYGSLSIEFKTPKGTGIVSDKQKTVQKRLINATGSKCIIVDSYDNAIVEILDYMSTSRIKCQYCKGKFKNDKTLKNHLKGFHKMD